MQMFYIPHKQIICRPQGFVKSPFRYPGGKFYALKFILPYIENIPHDEFREPFIGGGNIFFAKSKAQYNWLNDLDADIIDMYSAFSEQSVRTKLISELSKETASRERHREIKELTPTSFIDKSYRTFYLNRTSYSGIINKPAWGYAEGKSSPPENWGNFIEPAGKKLHGAKLTSYDFAEVINAPAVGKNVFLYVDPPYFHADQKRAYTKSFIENDHIRLEEELRKSNYLFCLSYDDCDEIRDLYHWAEIHEETWLYNSANCNGKQRKHGKELIITNYKIYYDLFEYQSLSQFESHSSLIR